MSHQRWIRGSLEVRKQGRRHQKSNTGVSVAYEKHLCPPKIVFVLDCMETKGFTHSIMYMCEHFVYDRDNTMFVFNFPEWVSLMQQYFINDMVMNYHCLIILCHNRRLTTFTTSSELTLALCMICSIEKAKTFKNFPSGCKYLERFTLPLRFILSASNTCVSTTIKSHNECFCIKITRTLLAKNKSRLLPWRAT